MNNPPCKTLYFRNLNEKVRPSELKRRLEVLISRYVSFVDVVARSSVKCRGQAFATLETVDEAKKVRSLLNRLFFMGKAMEVAFAREVTRKYDEEPKKKPYHGRVLVVKGLAEEVTKDDLMKAFQDEPGLAGIRHVSVKKTALIDFSSGDACLRCLERHAKDGISVCGTLYKLEEL